MFYEGLFLVICWCSFFISLWIKCKPGKVIEYGSSEVFVRSKSGLKIIKSFLYASLCFEILQEQGAERI
jgi:hypothetical protein